MAATLTPADLTALGRTVVNGVAVKAIEQPDEDVTWQEMQRKCYRVFAEAGCEVYWLSQTRRSGQTPGLPDLIVFGPPGAPFHLAWETKAGRGGPSEAQRKFALHCHRTGFPYRIGNARMARRVLYELTESSAARQAGAGEER